MMAGTPPGVPAIYATEPVITKHFYKDPI